MTTAASDLFALFRGDDDTRPVYSEKLAAAICAAVCVKGGGAPASWLVVAEAVFPAAFEPLSVREEKAYRAALAEHLSGLNDGYGDEHAEEALDALKAGFTIWKTNGGGSR